MPRLALALYALFFALAFGWRTWWQLRTTGRSGFAGISRGSALERAGGARFGVALVLGVAAPVLALTGSGPALFAPQPVLGCALYAIGLALTLWAQRTMGGSWRIGVDPSERTQLVTSGAFAFARNAIFTGMLGVALGLALLLPNAPAIAAVASLVIALELQVRLVEEPYLTAQRGEA
jgi:protein-S-isoprenylcysteine O-methyltransferase Ste14